MDSHTSKLSILLASTLVTFNAFSAQVPNIFSSNTPAVAADVNENFQYVLDNNYAALMINGEIDSEVDCSSNAAALNEEYAKYVHYSNLNFSIKGDCYGDILVKREFDEEQGWTGTSYQPAGQSIHIGLQDGQSGGLIPNDLSGRVTIWGGFGGGLYLNDLTITMGEEDIGVAFSRNGQGSLNNVTINGPESNSGTAVWIQEGAQVYINGLTTTSTGRGVMGRNGALIRFLETPSNITSQWESLRILGASILQQSEINVTSTDGTAVFVENHSRWNGSNQTINVSGGVHLAKGSNIALGTLNASSHDLYANKATLDIDHINAVSANLTSSKLKANGFNVPGGHVHIQSSDVEVQTLSATSLYLDGSNVYTWAGGTVSSNTDVTRNSYLRATDATFNSLWADRHASIEGENLTVADLGSSYNSVITLNNSTISNGININSNSSTYFFNVTFNGSSAGFNHSVAEFFGTSKVDADKIFCSGLTRISYEGVSDFLLAQPNSNCLDAASEATLMNMIKSNHIPN